MIDDKAAVEAADQAGPALDDAVGESRPTGRVVVDLEVDAAAPTQASP